MKEIKIALTDEEMEEIEYIWKLNQERIRKEILEKINWNRAEDFVGDVFRYGMDKVSEDPKGFIRMKREEKDPLFAEMKKASQPVKRTKEEWKTAYA